MQLRTVTLEISASSHLERGRGGNEGAEEETLRIVEDRSGGEEKEKVGHAKYQGEIERGWVERRAGGGQREGVRGRVVEFTVVGSCAH